MSVGAGVIKRMDQDNFDNGVYWLDFTKEGWEIVGREFFENRKEQSRINDNVEKMANDIWEDCFPKKESLCRKRIHRRNKPLVSPGAFPGAF